MRIINKFGGSIMWSPHRKHLALQRIQEQIQQKHQSIGVLSALYGVTDMLVHAIEQCTQETKEKPFDIAWWIHNLEQHHLDHCEELFEQADKSVQYSEHLKTKIHDLCTQLQHHLLSLRTYGNLTFIQDAILSAGERFSLYIFEELCKQHDIPCYALNGGELGIRTNQRYSDADILAATSKQHILDAYALMQWWSVLLVTWFDGKDEMGRITTLWRGGSDTTACFLGYALEADKVILRKDVPGVLSCDPRIVPEARTIPFLDFDEAEESWKVVCPKAIHYLKMQAGIHLEVTSLEHPEQYTLVHANVPFEKKAKLLSYVDKALLLQIHGERMNQCWYLARLAGEFKNHQINMLLIRNTRNHLYIVVKETASFHTLLQQLEQNHHVRIVECSMINIIGHLERDIAYHINTLLKRYQHELWFGVFPHDHCVRHELLVPRHVFKEVIQEFYETFLS